MNCAIHQIVRAVAVPPIGLPSSLWQAGACHPNSATSGVTPTRFGREPVLLRFHQVSLSICAGGWAGRIAGYHFEEDPATGCRIDAESVVWCGDVYIAGRPVYQIFRAIDVVFCGSRN